LTIRIGLVSIVVGDQDHAGRFSRSRPAPPLARTSAGSAWSPEDPDRVQPVLHRTDEPAQAFLQASRQAGRPVLSLRTGDRERGAERLKAKGIPHGAGPDGWTSRPAATRERR
jgi:hypothetical protein